jgi:hypothetical protein
VQALSHNVTLVNIEQQRVVEINDFIKSANEFISITMKFRDTITQSHLQQIKFKAKALGIRLDKQESKD